MTARDDETPPEGLSVVSLPTVASIDVPRMVHDRYTRTRPRSWRALADDFSARTGVSVSHESLRRWSEGGYISPRWWPPLALWLGCEYDELATALDRQARTTLVMLEAKVDEINERQARIEAMLQELIKRQRPRSQ